MIERDFYPLSVLCERWGCTAHDLMHLGIQGRIQVCVNIYGMASGVRRTRIEVDPPEPVPDNAPLIDEGQQKAQAANAAFERRGEHAGDMDMPHGVYEVECDDLRALDMPGAIPYELHGALKFDCGWWECEFDPPISIAVDHLCMLREEVLRADMQIFGNGNDAVAPQTANAPINQRAETTYLNIIGGLLGLMLGTTPGGKKGSAYDSQTAVIDALLAHHGDKQGIAKSTLEQKFADANRSIKAT